jgi:ABC-type transport system involved in multi-copper enzyme maturation permease subunit
MIASLRGEVLKSRKRWAYWILFGTLLLLLIAFSYLIPYLVLTHPPPRLETAGVQPAVLKRETFPENLFPELFNSMMAVGAAIMIVFGGLSSASEYGWLTVQTILVQKPGRIAVLLGKLANLAIVVLLLGLAALGVAALMSYILVTIDGSSSSWPSATTLLKGAGAVWLQLAVWTAFGMFLGIAFRSTAGAIAGGLVYFFAVEAIVGQLFRQTDIVKEVLKFLPGQNAAGLNAAFPFTIRNPNVTTPLVSAGRGAITLAVYLVVFSLAALLIFRQRDVSGS